MKKLILMSLVLSGILSMLFFPGCKESGESGPWALTVTMGEGIIGSPATGSATYDDGTVLTYDYSLQAKYGNLTVTLDGAAIASSGSITMDADHTLIASAVIDVRGDTWTGQAHHDGTPSWKVYQMQFNFTGSITSGTATGKIETVGNVSGPWSINDKDFLFTVPVQGIPLDLIGTLSNENYMSGTFDFDDNHGNHVTGTWYLER